MTKILEDVMKPRANGHMLSSLLQFSLCYKAPVHQFTKQRTSTALDREDLRFESKEGKAVERQPLPEIETTELHYTRSVGIYQKLGCKAAENISVLETIIHFWRLEATWSELLGQETAESTGWYLLIIFGGRTRPVIFCTTLRGSDCFGRLPWRFGKKLMLWRKQKPVVCMMKVVSKFFKGSIPATDIRARTLVTTNDFCSFLSIAALSGMRRIWCALWCRCGHLWNFSVSSFWMQSSTLLETTKIKSPKVFIKATETIPQKEALTVEQRRPVCSRCRHSLCILCISLEIGIRTQRYTKSAGTSRCHSGPKSGEDSPKACM